MKCLGADVLQIVSWLGPFLAQMTLTELGCCSLGAAVQGMDETAVNGAQLVSLLRGGTASLFQFRIQSMK